MSNDLKQSLKDVTKGITTNGTVETAALESKPATVKPIDSYFTVEHQGMIAAKYRVKYSDADQQQHKASWPEFAGNHFVMYVLAETLLEARKAVFSANRTILLNSLTGALVNYTPTEPGAVLTELQVAFNKTSDLQLQGLYEQIPDESQRVELLKAFSKNLKQAAKTGKDTDTARAKFYHASAVMGIPGNLIW
jgi:hypothetical protein